MRRYLILACILIGPILEVQAREFVVDPSGAGDRETIQGALSSAAAGDTVLVLPGSYLENLAMTSGVTLISRDGAETTVINGNGDICLTSVRCATGTRVTGFTFLNGKTHQVGGIHAFDNTDIVIAHNVFRNQNAVVGGAAVNIQRYSHALIHDNRFIGNTGGKAGAISVIVYATANIRNNYFEGNHGESHAGSIGINRSTAEICGNIFADNISGGPCGTVDFYRSTGHVFNNTFLRNRGKEGAPSGLSIRGPDSSVTVARNLFAGNLEGSALSTQDCRNISCNIFWDNESDFQGECPPFGRDGNLQVDPRLCGSTDRPGALAPDSPCFQAVCNFVGADPVPGCLVEEGIAVEK